MHEERIWLVGIDWGSEEHVVSLYDNGGGKIGQRKFPHGGTGIADMIAWLLKKSGGTPGEIHVAIETPHGPIVEALLERGFNVYSINPKQLDRFRDRFTVAGVKDDSLDADVLADSLRTDMRLFRKLSIAEPLIVELREWSRIDEDLKVEHLRLANRLKDQLWRYYPQMLELADDIGANWFLDLWEAAPTPEKAARVREPTIARVLKNHRIRRFDAAHVLSELRKPALTVAREQSRPPPLTSALSSSSCGSSTANSPTPSGSSTGCAKNLPSLSPGKTERLHRGSDKSSVT
jgi:Transposase